MGLPALDIPEEWWFDNDSQHLYFMTPDGKAPAKGSVRGKRRDFQLSITDSEYVTVKGFDLWRWRVSQRSVKLSPWRQ